MVYFETQRLRFRDWEENDLKLFQEMNRDAAVREFFPKTLTEDETTECYNKIRDEISQSGYGFFAVETLDDGEFIGFIGFHEAIFAADFTPCTEIGWRLKREAWGKGYATEGAKACLRYGFDRLGFDRVYSFTAKTNHPSENVMKKIGMKKIGEFRHPNVQGESPLSEHVLYCVDASCCKSSAREVD